MILMDKISNAISGCAFILLTILKLSPIFFLECIGKKIPIIDVKNENDSSKTYEQLEKLYQKFFFLVFFILKEIYTQPFVIFHISRLLILVGSNTLFLGLGIHYLFNGAFNDEYSSEESDLKKGFGFIIIITMLLIHFLNWLLNLNIGNLFTDLYSDIYNSFTWTSNNNYEDHIYRR